MSLPENCMRHPWARCSLRNAGAALWSAVNDLLFAYRNGGTGFSADDAREVGKGADGRGVAGGFREAAGGLDLGPHRAGGEFERRDAFRGCPADGLFCRFSPIDID